MVITTTSHGREALVERQVVVLRPAAHLYRADGHAGQRALFDSIGPIVNLARDADAFNRKLRGADFFC